MSNSSCVFNASYSLVIFSSVARLRSQEVSSLPNAHNARWLFWQHFQRLSQKHRLLFLVCACCIHLLPGRPRARIERVKLSTSWCIPCTFHHIATYCGWKPECGPYCKPNQKQDPSTPNCKFCGQRSDWPLGANSDIVWKQKQLFPLEQMYYKTGTSA